MALPDGFPVDWEGRITCGTCHDPHAGDPLANPYLLHGRVRGQAFCSLCHEEIFWGTGRHPVIDGYAHSRSWTPPDSVSVGADLDKVSYACLICHDGTSIGGPADFQASGQTVRFSHGRSLSHPIGMDYSEAAAGNRELRSLESLSPRISLYEGKVGCASCHSMYSAQQSLLVFGNEGSALCLECHLK